MKLKTHLKNKIMKFKKYRVIKDMFIGYQVQAWRLWFPFWYEVGSNSYATLDNAKDAIKIYKNTVVYTE